MSSTVTTWSTDANTKATATTSVNDTFLRGYLPWITNTSFYDDNADTIGLPFQMYLEQTSNPPHTNDVQYRLFMPYAGYLDKILFRCSTTADTVDFEIYKAANGTDGDDADQNKLSSTVTVEDDTAHTLVTATFGTTYSFEVGDVMAITMANESAPGDVDMQVIWKVLVT